MGYVTGLSPAQDITLSSGSTTVRSSEGISSPERQRAVHAYCIRSVGGRLGMEVNKRNPGVPADPTRPSVPCWIRDRSKTGEDGT